MVLTGIMVAAVVIPFAQLLRPSPESMGLLPDGDVPVEDASPGVASKGRLEEANDFTVSEALKTSSYWLLAVGTMLRTGTLGTLIVHFVPMMVWKGHSEQTAAVMLGMMAFLSIPTRIGLGYLGDSWSRTKILSGGMALGALCLILLQNANSLLILWLFISIFSFVEGLSALNWALVGDFFGRKRFATLRGILSLVYSWGMILMPVIAGTIYDRTDSYNIVIWIFMAMYVVGAIIFLIIRKPTLPARQINLTR